jgi:hypothetical protein
MSFGIYIIGFLILIGGLIWAAVILHMAAHWIAVGAIVLLGLAILKGVQATWEKIRRTKKWVFAKICGTTASPGFDYSTVLASKSLTSSSRSLPH